MQPEIKRSCSDTPVAVDSLMGSNGNSHLTPEIEREYLDKAAAQASGKPNVWTEGFKRMLVGYCEPEELGKVIAPLGNEDMLRLVGAIWRQGIFVVTPDTLYEAGIPIQINPPS